MTSVRPLCDQYRIGFHAKDLLFRMCVAEHSQQKLKSTHIQHVWNLSPEGQSTFCWNRWKGWQQWELEWGQKVFWGKSQSRNIMKYWIPAQLQCWLSSRVSLCLPARSLCRCCFALFLSTIILALSNVTIESSLRHKLCKVHVAIFCLCLFDVVLWKMIKLKCAVC